MNTEENKYYTPSIEEFHEGFQYEFLIPERIYTGTIGTPDFKLFEIKLKWHKRFWNKNEFRLSKYKPSTLRVKYLDKEDIESLDFEFTSENKFNDLQRYNHIYKQYHIIIYNGKLSIYHTPEIEKQHFELCVFNGVIKNKSELIKLMKQLNIE